MFHLLKGGILSTCCNESLNSSITLTKFELFRPPLNRATPHGTNIIQKYSHKCGRMRDWCIMGANIT